MKLMCEKLSAQVAELPSTSGVYFFYREKDQRMPLYIGKSCNIKKRVKSHYHQAKVDLRESKLMQQVRHITFIQTAGEIGALLLEASLIKKYLPLFNRQLRKSRFVYYYQLVSAGEDYKLLLLSSKNPSFQPLPNCYGLFRNQKQAKDYLVSLCKEFKLCPQVVGLTKGLGSCFNYQLKRCLGVCCGEEAIQEHNKRLLKALNSVKHLIWPYSGKIGIVERNSITQSCEIHLINQWRYLGTQAFDEIKNVISDISVNQKAFDYDHYRILLRALMQEESEGFQVVELDRV